MRDIGKNIRQLRIRKHMTQDELAEKLFVTRQTVSNYETGRSQPDIGMLMKISEVLETDVNHLLYGQKPNTIHPELYRLIAGVLITALFAILWGVIKAIGAEVFSVVPELLLFWAIRPLCCLFGGWTAAELLGMALNRRPLSGIWPRRIGVFLMVLLILWFVLCGWYLVASLVNHWQFENHIRGEWEEVISVSHDGKEHISMGWKKLPPQVPEWVSWIVLQPMVGIVRYRVYHFLMLLPGAALWICGIPDNRKKKQA